MGLLDDFSGFVKTPEGQGLLSAIAGGLAGARRGAPINSLGVAGLAGLRGYGQAQESQQAIADKASQQKMQQAMYDLQLKKLNKPERFHVGNVLLEDGPEGVKPVYTAPTERKAPEGMQYGADGSLSAIPGYVEMKSKIAAAGRNPAAPTPFFQFLPTATGYAVGDARTGNISQAALNGQPVIKASDSPTLQGEIAKSKEFGKTQGEDAAKAVADYPRIVQNADVALKHADELMKHPGFSQAVGASSMLGIQKIPGTDAKGFMNRLDQIKGGAFLEAFNTLKGGGQITEVEGKKATDAIARMDNATSEQDFKAAMKDYTDVIRAGKNRARMKAKPIGPVQPVQPAPTGGAKFLGFE